MDCEAKLLILCSEVEVAVISQKMIFDTALVTLSALLLASCGESSSTTKVPTADDPSSGPTEEITTVDPGTDNRLPDLSRAAYVTLEDNTNYSGLEALAGVVYPPVIGMPALQLTVSDPNRSGYLSGKVLFAFEDNKPGGFWAAELPSVDLAARHTGTSIDAIFSDSEFTLRVRGQISSAGKMRGDILYRLRAGSDTQCQAIRCTDWYHTQVECSAAIKLANAQACRDYMFEGGARVKPLGAFSDFDYTKWLQ